MNQHKIACRLGIALLICVLGACGDSRSNSAPGSNSPAVPVATSNTAAERTPQNYVGSEVCGGCHQAEAALWRTSHHAQAMQKIADVTPSVRTSEQMDTPAGLISLQAQADSMQVHITTGEQVSKFPITHTLGVTPLLQYLVDVGKGHLQVLDPALITASNDRPYSLQRIYPDVLAPNDPLHWQQPGQNWNAMCADCHVTNFEKHYARKPQSYASTFSELGVGCEACHGPGSLHVEQYQKASNQELADNKYIYTPGAERPEIDVCMQCHSRREQLQEGFRPGLEPLDYYSPALLEADLYHVDGQVKDEVYVYGSFLQSKMHNAGVTCGDCHNSHSGQLKATGDQLCMQCHSEAGQPRFPTLPKRAYNTTAHRQHASQIDCVDCHMPSTTFMQVDERRDHSFRIPALQFSQALGVPDTCAQCHAPQIDWSIPNLAFKAADQPDQIAVLMRGAARTLPSAEAGLAKTVQNQAIPAIKRASAAERLGNYSSYGGTQALLAALKDSSALVRIGALRGSRRWSPETRLQRVRLLLDDPILAVRLQAVKVVLPDASTLTPASQALLKPYLERYIEQLQIHADRAEGLTNLASVYQALNQFEKAEAVLEEATLLNRNWIPAWINMADLLRQTGRDAQGGHWLDGALNAQPDNPQVLLAKAMWMVRQEDRDRALPLLERAWVASPNEGEFAYVYAVALHSAGRSPEALDLLTKSIPDHPHRVALHRLAMQIAQDQGDMATVARLLSLTP